MKKTLLFSLSLLILLQTAFSKEERILILGDSIPHNGGWPTLVAEAIHQKKEFAQTPVVNISVPSETLSGLSDPGHAGGAFPRPCLHERLGRVVNQFQPTLIIACYGMNDGFYQPLSSTTFNAFKLGAERLKNEAGAMGAKVIFVTTPLYKPDQEQKNGQAEYDKTLSAFASWLVSQSSKGYHVIDIRPYLKKAISKTKSINPQFTYANDGIHPGDEGHQFIAQAICAGLSKFLKTPAKPKFSTGEEFKQAKKKLNDLQTEWLGKTMHKRPQIAGYKAYIPYFQPPGVKVSKWNKFERHDFNLEGRKATIVFPENPLPGKPWIWSSQPLDNSALLDIAMIGRGFTHVHTDIPDTSTSPKALDLMTEFYTYITSNYGLSRRPVLEPFGKASLYAFRWAKAHPKWVSCIIANGETMEREASAYKKLGGLIKAIPSPQDQTNKTVQSITPAIDFIFKATKHPLPTSIICIGDSITEGSGVKPHERWSHLVSEQTGQGYTICNQGFSARTLLAKGDHPYTKEPMYKNALNGKFDVALIALGTNDSKPQNWKHKDEFIKDYKAIIHDLRQSNPKIKIYCLKAPPSTSTHEIRGEIIEREINPMIEKIATDNQCRTIDIFTPMKNRPDLFPDKVHPNAEGHSIIAREVNKSILAP